MKYGRARLIAYSHSRRTYGENIEFDDQKSWNTSASSIKRSNACPVGAEAARGISRRNVTVRYEPGIFSSSSNHRGPTTTTTASTSSRTLIER
jgi:hypothetical protein